MNSSQDRWALELRSSMTISLHWTFAGSIRRNRYNQKYTLDSQPLLKEYKSQDRLEVVIHFSCIAPHRH